MASTGTCARCGFVWPADRFEACPRCLFEAEAPAVVLGGVIELGEEIGRGGMGTVHRGLHRRLGRDVAVKLLPPELASDGDARARFEREARTLARLSHPNIVAVYDAGEDDGQCWLVMELVDCVPLTPQAPMQVARALAIAVQVCDGLAHAHAHGVVHRDIKPENILVDAAGHAKVTDFGIARVIGADAAGWTVTRPGGVVGTPHYLPPEALDGKAPPDPRMDIWSVGVVLHQLVTGALPIGRFAPAPAPVDAIVRKALAPRPEDRYQSAAEMAAALRAAAGAAAAADALPAEEHQWIAVVALLQSVSTAVAAYAVLQSITPKVMRADELGPLVVFAVERLADGRIVSRARFEPWWTLAALVTFAAAITAYAPLRRHWRRSGLELHEPGAPVRPARRVLAWGVGSLVSFALLVSVDAVPGFGWFRPYRPVFGGAIEIGVLYTFWVALLHAWRTGRPFRREPLIWVGLLLALLPPVIDVIRFIARWQP